MNKNRIKYLLALVVAIQIAACDSSSSSSEPDTTILSDATEPESVYLNDKNITVALGENTLGNLYNTTGLQNIVDADNAVSEDIHSQSTHVWHTGEQLELNL